MGASRRLQRRAYRAGGPVLNCGRCRENTNQAQDPQKMVRIETPLHPRIRKMLEAVPQRGEGRSGLRDEDESCNVIHHWHWSHSSPVVGSHIGVCVMTTYVLVVVLDSSVGFLSERKEWVCARHSHRALGSCNLPALYREAPGHGCILSAKPVPHFDCFSAA